MKGQKKLRRIGTHPIQRAEDSVRRGARQQHEDNSVRSHPTWLSDNEDSVHISTVTLDHSQKVEDIAQPRLVSINDPDAERLKAANNSIKTSKYNPITFLPVFLLEMFSRVAYLYFLIQAGLSWWSVVSPFNGFGATMALSFVLVVSAAKAAAEDFKRHVEDGKTNKSKATLVDPLTGEEKTVRWKALKVGNFVKVHDDELFPADIVCLKAGLHDNVCFIRTSNLDGESNLKIRKPVDLRLVPGLEESMKSTEDMPFIFKHRACLECEQPNGNLHKFRGRFTVAHESVGEGPRHTSIPVAMSEMLLRGTVLKNSKHVYGMVVYTGKESKIQMNASRNPMKIGSFDRFLNVQIALLGVAQLVVCVILAGGNVLWREYEGFDRFYLGFDAFVQGNLENNGQFMGLVFLTFWILTSYMVPISLFVTIEIVKFWQAFVFINNDPKLIFEDEPARARNSCLNEDLGKVNYVFSDKTGTLTSNDMQLRMVSIKGQAYGSTDFRYEDVSRTRLEEHAQTNDADSSLQAFDERLYNSVDRLQAQGYWQGLMSVGGSREYILSLPDSQPRLNRMKTMDRKEVVKEISELEPKMTSRKLEVKSLESQGGKASSITVHSEHMDDCVLGWHLVDFWTNICVCQSLIIEDRPDADGTVSRVYQGPSPDEVALVEAGRNLGFEFKERTMDGVTLSMQGVEVKFEILNVMDFSSDRKRMSVVARAEDGTIRLFSKGADNIMLARLKDDIDPSLLDSTTAALHDYSVKGLRTLVLATKLVDAEDYKKWDASYQEAAGSMSSDRDFKVDQIADGLERDLELVGITAIEDKLQDGVPMAIETLRLGGIKVWMITGDKMETAINIGISCNLVSNRENLLVLTAEHHFEAKENLAKLISDAHEKMSDGSLVELIVDGPSLQQILGKSVEKDLAYLGSLCSGVVVCRSSPSQKASIVRIMKEFELRQVEKGPFGIIGRAMRKQNLKIKVKTLGIGDGANDVAMIQAADIGVGIAGKEGRQAVNNSDFAVGQFKFLVRLLMVHGQLSHYRLGRLIKFSFFKNITFAFVLVYYQFFCGFSGQTLVDDISAAMFNVVFTSMPILLFSLLDRPVDDEILIRFPHMYNQGSSLSAGTFWRTGVMKGVFDAAVCFFIPLFSMGYVHDGTHTNYGLWAVGKTIFVCLLGCVTLECVLVARYWTAVFGVFALLSYGMIYPFMLAMPYMNKNLEVYDLSQFAMEDSIFGTLVFWLTIAAVYTITFGSRLLTRNIKWLYRPDDNMILAEFEQKYGALHDLTEKEMRRLADLDILVPHEDEDELYTGTSRYSQGQVSRK